MIKIGIIGGSGFYQLSDLKDSSEKIVNTEFFVLTNFRCAEHDNLPRSGFGQRGWNQLCVHCYGELPTDLARRPTAVISNRMFSIVQAAKKADLKDVLKETGTIVTVEGPRFSSRAESFMFKSWNAGTYLLTYLVLRAQ